MSSDLRLREHSLTAKPFWSAVLLLIGLMLLSSAAVTAGTAPYTGVKPDEFMKHWLILGPIPVSSEKSPDEDSQKKAFADDLLRPGAGESVVQPKAGARVVIGGKNYEWRQVESTNDIIDLKVAKTPEEFCIAYAWAEIEMPDEMRGLLGIGSDDGVKAWLNGKLIHENWIGRPPQPDDDVVPVEFKKGSNQLMLKIQNVQGPWGFVCRLLGPWKVVEAEVSFVKNDKGEVTKAIHKQGGQTINAPRMEDAKEAKVEPKAFDAYVGRYDYGGGKAVMTITREGNRLFAQLTGQPKFEIFPKSETEFFWKVVNAQVTFVKDKSGKVTKAIHEQSGQKFDAPRME